MSDSNSKKENNGKARASVPTDIIAIVLVLVMIAGYISYQIYTAVHVDVQTVTAVTSTVYDTIETQALVIRDEYTVDTASNGVTVACVKDGEKVKVNGNIAMEFSSEDNAKNYSSILELQEKLDYYLELESKSAGTATDVQSIDKDILNDVNEYIRNAGVNNTSLASQNALDLNDKLTRRQMIIGQKIDFSAVKTELQNELNSLNASSCKPTGYVTTEESGIFSSYTDGLESAFDYDNVKELDVKTFNSYLKKYKSAEPTQSFGKLINDYEWYFCCKLSADQVKNIKDGDRLSVALKNSDKVIECEVLKGATLDLGTKETVLVLKSSEMDSQITSMRLEDIEIRYDEYEGFKIPSKAIHINSEGEKVVYALVANQVVERKGEIIYLTKDYVIFSTNPENDASRNIRLYDQIIIQGKDLHDGKIYT